jgi:hypothetical protein
VTRISLVVVVDDEHQIPNSRGNAMTTTGMRSTGRNT